MAILAPADAHKYARQGVQRKMVKTMATSKRVILAALEVDFPRYLAIPLGGDFMEYLYKEARDATIKDFRVWFKHRKARADGHKKEFNKDKKFFVAVMAVIPADAEMTDRWHDHVEQGGAT